MTKFYKAFIFFLTLPIILYSQSQDLIFDHLTVDDGLSNNIVLAITQDCRGFMWFGTEDGLNKYDGYKFTVYQHDLEDSLSISDNHIWSLHESHHSGNHVLWVGTCNGGLNRLDLETEKFTHFKHDPDDLHSLSNNFVSSIFEDSFGNLWIGTHGGINKLDRKTDKFVRYQHDPKDSTSLSHNKHGIINESLTSNSSILWVGTWGGLNKFDRKTETFTRYLHDRDNPNSLSNNNINGLHIDNSGMLWIATQNGGLNKLNIETEQFTRFQHDPKNPNSLGYNIVVSTIEDRYQGKNVLWIATNNGLTRLDLETEQFTQYKNNPRDPKSLGDNTLHSIYKDRSGIIWMGSWGGGISKLEPKRQQFLHFQQEQGNKNRLSFNFVWSITQSQYYGPDVFWIGTKGGGLNKFNRNTGKFTHFRHDPGNPNSISDDLIFTTFESQYEGNAELWIGTLEGLDKLDLQTKIFTHYKYDPDDPYSIKDNIIRSLLVDKSGTLWVGTRNGGLNKFDRHSEKFTNYNIGEVLAINEDSKGTVWVDGLGLDEYIAEEDKFIPYFFNPEHSSNRKANQIFSLHEDKSLRLWIGTNGGLYLFNRENKKFTHYTVKNGLPNNVINGILEDKQGNLWLSTNHGISKFNTEKKTFRNFDINDGLQSNQFIIGAACLSTQGEMLFGGVNGINVFHPYSIKDNPHIPEIYLTDFQIFNRKVDVKSENTEDNDGNFYLPKHVSSISEIVLSYKENIFSFEFAALDYHSPMKNQYKYKMEGVDQDWVYTDASRRYVTYTQMDPGKYTFHVKASNNDGKWNDQGTSISIVITPPWWQTNMAYSFYILLIGSIVLGVWRIQTNRLKMRHQMEMDHLHTEKLEEVDRMKSRFFANISHEFRTPLTLILGPIEQMISGELKGNLVDQYKIIRRNGKRLLQLINQLLDLSKLESGKLKLQAAVTEIISLTNELVQAFESLAVRKNITLKFRTEIKSHEIYLDKDKYEKIINNLLSNAFKFTPEGGEIILDCGLRNADLNAKKNSKLRITNYEYFQITISNTGPGIPADRIDKIFDRFYQIDDSYTKDEEGTGIGLALTKELVELHHGTIEVDCRRGTMHRVPTTDDSFHTTFTVLLPIGKEHLKSGEIIEKTETEGRSQETGKQIALSNIPEEDTRYLIPDTQKQSKSSHRTPASGLQSPIVLIVEDNADLRKYIRGNMDNQYRIFEAENGKDGLEKATNEIPDLIISDVMMPKMDGFEFCTKIKTDERTSHIPVIMITARTEQEDKIEGLETGADDYITKPFDNKELNIRVKNLIEQRQKLRERFGRESNLNIDEIAHTSADEKFIKRIMDIISQHISDPKFNIESLSEQAGFSRMHLHRKIFGLFGQSPGSFLRTIRLKRGAELLKEKTGNISEIAYEVGFENPANFSTSFRHQFGISPSEHSRKLPDA